MVKARQKPSRMPGKYEKRVFIGGNYNYCALLYEIKDAVDACGLHGIITRDFGKRGAERVTSLEILAKCKYAIMEVSTDAGQMAEIEHLPKHNPALFLWDAGSNTQPRCSAMIKSHALFKKNNIGYKSLTHMQAEISMFLQRHDTRR